MRTCPSSLLNWKAAGINEIIEKNSGSWMNFWQ